MSARQEIGPHRAPKHATFGLLWRSALAFLLVALVSAILHSFVLMDLTRALASRPRAAQDLVRGAATEIARARGDAVRIEQVLARMQRRMPRIVLAYAATGESLQFAGEWPDGFGPREARRLQEQYAAHEGRLPQEWTLRSLMDEPPPRLRGSGPPEPALVAVAAVTDDRRLAGTVFAWRAGPPPTPRLDLGVRLMLVVPGTLLLGTLAGLLFSRGLLRRMRVLASHAARVGGGDLSARVGDPGQDEVGEVSRALDHMTDSLAEGRQRAADSERARSEMLAEVAHELATPLTAIRGYAEMVEHEQDSAPTGRAREYVTHISRAAARMERLLGDLLDLSRIEVGSPPLLRQRLDLAELCGYVLKAHRERFAQAEIRLEWRGLQGPTWIDADGQRMEQVLENLLQNALRYVPRGSTLMVSLTPATTPTGMHRLCVSDDGPGFPEEDLPRVFDRFYRAPDAATIGGSGLGLAIVREIVLRHDGQLLARNRTPRGAELEIALPAAS